MVWTSPGRQSVPNVRRSVRPYPHVMMGKSSVSLRMEANQGPQSGVNAWLEEELLQQYHHDRSSVDADWKDVFEHERSGNGNGVGVATLTAPTAVVHATPEPVLSGSEELMPLRGAAARIAENMALSAAHPAGHFPADRAGHKVIDENRRLINHHRARCSARARFPIRT